MSAPVFILGVSCFYHDSAAVLLRDGVVVAAAQEERFTRVKQDERFPTEAVRSCLCEAGIAEKDLSYVVFYDKPLLKFERILETAIGRWPTSFPQFIRAIPVWLRKKLGMRALIAKELPGYTGDVLFSQHHLSHAASAYYSSPFSDATVVTIDGVGEWETTTVGFGKGPDLSLTHALHFPHSLGLLYSALTGYLGFKVNSAEYKVMGLAPYGDPSVYREKMWSLVDRKPDGSFHLNMRYFAYEDRLRMTTGALHRLFGGAPRKPESPLTQREKDIAAALQEVTEELMLGLVRFAHSVHPGENLCLAGGVALNCVGNGRILREGPFKQIFIQPAAGDAGGALGAAQYVWHAVLKNLKGEGMKHAFLGPAFSTETIDTFLREQAPRIAGGVVHYRRVDRTQLPAEVATLIDGENVIGLLQGRMEFGPRSLGSRSIIADARRKENWQKVNLKIKFRESFRPFAPTVLEERVSDYFVLDRESPYMLLVADVRPEKRAEIPAVTHVDGSARIQTIRRDQNPLYYDILKAFEARTGCPVIINPSFNVRGEPIVCTPEDALLCFLHTDMDYLVLEDCILSKAENRHLVSGEKREAYLKTFSLD